MTILELVREGMAVVDNTGAHVGSVRDLKLGDPEAASAEGHVRSHSGGLAGLLRLPQMDALSTVPDEERAHLLRTGYIDIRRDGLLHHGSLLVAADEIDRVEHDIIVLRIGQADRTH